MLRIAWLTCVCVLVTGCATRADPPPSAATGCAALALTRMQDAAANDYDQADQQIIYRGTYQDCLKWQDKAKTIGSFANKMRVTPTGNAPAGNMGGDKNR